MIRILFSVPGTKELKLLEMPLNGKEPDYTEMDHFGRIHLGTARRVAYWIPITTKKPKHLST